MSSPPPEYTSRPSSLRPPRPSYEGPSLSPSPSPPPGGAAARTGTLGKAYPQHWQTHDPRSSSSQSLVPSIADGDDRRTLLIVYIHGFMGNDTSFRSFPAHVHNYLRQALLETHAIHSKVYPRYKTYKAIDVARDNFSKWLEPHESDTTDVVLVGHSMGGILAADIVLIPSPNPVMGHPYKHRILGTISLDSPFLGLHPGIIVSGIASLFRKDEEQTQQPGYPNAMALEPNTSGSLSPDPSLYNELDSLSGVTSPSTMTTVSSATSPPPTGDATQSDPYFNPPFFNDVQFRDRGWWKNIAHFTKKHRSEGIFSSAANHIVSHLEFGSCLADYPALNGRYNRLRRLEDVDDFGGAAKGDARVRFVNYFTISTGRLKKPPPSSPPPLPPRSQPTSPPATKPSSPFLRPQDAEPRRSVDGSSPGSTPRISIEDHSDDGRPVSMQYIAPEPLPDEDEPTDAKEQATPADDADPADPANAAPENPLPDVGITRENTLPAIPDAPEPPQPPNLEQYTDKEERKQAEKEARRVQKAYEQAVKNRDKAVRERQKLVEKRRKQAAKDAQKREKEEQKRVQRREKEEHAALQKEISELNLAGMSGGSSSKDVAASSVSSPPGPVTPAGSSQQGQQQEEKAKKKKERKFCMLPMKGPNGARDPAWVRIDMEGVDEVGAHCGLFFPGPHYEKLIGDVGSRIVSWVQEDASKRAILALD